MITDKRELRQIVLHRRIMAGHDAEFFLQNSAGKYISSVGIIPGTKEEPFKTTNGWVQQDNVAGEINIKPSKSVQQFVEWTHGTMQDLTDMIAPLNLAIQVVASAEYEEDQLQTREAMHAGCDPDMCVYTEKENPKPDVCGGVLRSAGGHIHLSWKNPLDHEKLAVVRNADLFITLPGLFLDEDNRRRELYGKAGAYRPKTYGVEIRSPSNFWARSKSMMAWAYWQAIACVANMDEADRYPNVEEVINTRDYDEASRIIAAFKIPMPKGAAHAV